MLKKLFAIILVSFLLCGCTKNKKEILTFSSWGSVTEVSILKKVIKEFEIQNPDIKINFIHIPQNYFQKVHLLFASNTAPDVLFINNLYLPVYQKELENLNNIVDKNVFFKQSVDAMTINGTLYAVPRDISNLVLFYNKDYIKSEPKNFDEFDKQIKKYYGKNIFGISYERNIFYAEPYILTLGNNDGIKYYLDLEGKYAPKPSDIGSSTLAQMFLDGKIAYYLSGRWMYPKISETANFDYGVTVFPGKIYSDASGWAISKKSKNKAAAEKFVKHLVSKESIDYFTSTGLIVPARKDSAKILTGKNEAFTKAIETSVKREFDINYNKNRDNINKKLFN